MKTAISGFLVWIFVFLQGYPKTVETENASEKLLSKHHFRPGVFLVKESPLEESSAATEFRLVNRSGEELFYYRRKTGIQYRIQNFAQETWTDILPSPDNICASVDVLPSGKSVVIAVKEPLTPNSRVGLNIVSCTSDGRAINNTIWSQPCPPSRLLAAL